MAQTPRGDTVLPENVDKRALIASVCARLERDLEGIKAAAAASYEAAIGEESKPENEYDTRGLEASYIATAQSKRAGEIAAQLAVYRSLPLRDFAETEAIGATALIEVERAETGRGSIIFLLPKGGGLSVSFAGTTVQAIGPESPLGEALIGMRQGDDAVVDTGRGVQTYEILRVR